MALVQSKNKIKLFADQINDDAETLRRSTELPIFAVILSCYKRKDALILTFESKIDTKRKHANSKDTKERKRKRQRPRS